MYIKNFSLVTRALFTQALFVMLSFVLTVQARGANNTHRVPNTTTSSHTKSMPEQILRKQYEQFKKILDPDEYKPSPAYQKAKKTGVALVACSLGTLLGSLASKALEYGIHLRHDAEQDLREYGIAQELRASYSLLSGMMTSSQACTVPLGQEGAGTIDYGFSLHVPEITQRMRTARTRIKKIDQLYWLFFLGTTLLSSWLMYHLLSKKYCNADLSYQQLLAAAVKAWQEHKEALPEEFWPELDALLSQSKAGYSFSEDEAEKIVIDWVLRILAWQTDKKNREQG